MKTKLLFMIAAACIFLLGSCYEDKGNYDYQPAVSADFSTYLNSLSTNAKAGYLGQPFKISPKINFSGYSDPQDTLDFDFWWEWTGDMTGNADHVEVVCEERELNFIPDKIGYVWYRACARHRPSGLISSGAVQLNITSPYGKGWTILSEKDSRSSLSFILPGYEVPATRTGRLYTQFHDIYHNLYGANSPLGAGPKSLHLLLNNESSSLMVAQQSRVISLNGMTFEVEVPLDDEFVGQAYPAGFAFKDFFYGGRLDAVLSANGDLYTRDYNLGQGEFASTFHYSFFNPSPLQFEGESMHVDILLPTHYPSCAYYGFVNNDVLGGHGNVWWIYNQGNQNIMLGAMQKTQIADQIIPPGNYVDLNDFGGWQMIMGGGYASSDKFFMAFKKGSDLRTQVFKVQGSGDPRSFAISDITVTDATGVLDVAADSKYYLCRYSEYLFYSNNNKVYLYKIATATNVLLYSLPASDKITALTCNPQESELGVACETGKVVMLDIQTNLDDVKPIGEPMTGFGRIVDMIYKFPTNAAYSSGLYNPD